MAIYNDQSSLDSDRDRKDLEKAEIIEIVGPVNNYANIGLSNEDAEFFENFPEDKKSRMYHKVDVRLVPVLALLYLAAHIDRANIGNAKIEGMTDDLHLSGIQYNIVLSIFFIPYILLEVPSNLLLKKFKRPSLYMATLVISWGTIMTLTGLCKNFAGLMVCRVLLGIAEAGFFPGAVYIITCWYPARKVQLRLALFYCASALSGAFSGLLAFGIARMNGIAGVPGWAWIFILEGMATVFIGVAVVFIMPDTPALAGKWLTEEEQRYLCLQNLIRAGGNAMKEHSDKTKWPYFVDLIKDYKLYLQAWSLFVASVCAYGLKFTMPSITKSMGYTSSQAQLLTIPPYVAGALSAVILSKFSDKVGKRMPFVASQMAVVALGFAILLPLAANISRNIAACYIGVVLICVGQYPTNPASSAWISSNLAGENKRAMGIALNIAIGNAGGIVGSYMFLDSEAPGYKTGFSIGLAFALITVVTTLVLGYSYWSINKKRAAMDPEEIYAKYTTEDLARLGDKSPLFKYKL